MTETTTATTAERGTLTIPEADSPTRTPRDDLDRAVADVAENATAWTRLGLTERIALLDEMIRETAAVAEDWGATASLEKGLTPESAAWGEDLATGPLVLVRNLRMLRETLEDLLDDGEIDLPGEPYSRTDGQVVVPVFPTGWIDRTITPGHRGEIWMQPHVTLDTLRVGMTYREPFDPGVCFVLGAGNVSSIGAKDCLHKLFAENHVCVLKFNPVNAHLGPYVERALAPLVREGYLRVVYGGADEGRYLTDHPSVDSIHMTGSDKTHDAVVFGEGDEGRRRKQAGEVRLDKPVTSELGNVTPIIVVPGPWSDDDIAYQAKYIASMLTNNGGFNCAAARIVVTHPRWNRRRRLLDAIRSSLAEAQQREPYYPGARDRWERFVTAHPEAETFGSTAGGHVPWTFIPGLDAGADDDVMFGVEAFNGIFGEVPVDAPTDVPAWLERASTWCNETLWGTLACTLLVHPQSLKDPAVEAAVDEAVARLRYGSIAVNAWAAVSYGLTSTTWGAFPGHPPEDIQSGRGVVHNTFMLEDPQKSVIHAPWRLGKKPPMSYDFTTMGSLAQRLIRLEAFGDWKQLPGIVWDGIRA